MKSCPAHPQDPKRGQIRRFLESPDYLFPEFSMPNILLLARDMAGAGGFLNGPEFTE
jgi:hypothetical protein